MESEWQHPFVEQYSKEAYNLMAEFHAAVESESYEDASRMITDLDPYAAEGLVPAGSDSQLLVSVPTAIRSAMRHEAKLAEMMNAEFAPLGRLRVNQAISAGNEAAVLLATVQYHGTEAAGAAHGWLGDRALASGEFLPAIAHYERAMQQVGVLEKNKIAPRMRLAAAMLGRDFGQPPTAAVEFGDVQMGADEFEALVAEMRTAHAGAADSIEVDFADPQEQAPPPTGFQVHRRGRLDGEAGESPNSIDGNVRNYDVPWLERQLGIAVAGDVAYVNNRFHVAAYDLKSDGKRLWQSPPPPDRGRTRDWMLTAMRPIVAGERIYVRQLTKSGPLLVCLDNADGKHVWLTEPNKGDEIISDPLVADGRLFALTLHRTGRGNDQLHLTSYALDSGEMVGEKLLLEMRESWRQRRVCRTTQLADGFLASLGGLVLNVDFLGNVRWARKQSVLPAALEPAWVGQRLDRPLVAGDRAFVASPGVRNVECMDVDSGRLYWRRTLPFVDRLVGLADGRLIVHAGDEFLALAAETGEILWRRQILASYDAELCGGASGILIAHQIVSPSDANQHCPELVWLNAADGSVTAQTTLSDLQEKTPRFGPLLMHGDRLWTFFGTSIEDANRDLVELQPKGEAERPANADQPAADDSWLVHTNPELREAAAGQFPQWSLLATGYYGGFGHIDDIHGEKDLIALPANGASPVVFARQLTVPKSGRPRLEMRLGSEPNQHWRLVVRFGERVLLERDMEWSKEPQVFKDIKVDLKPVAGESGWLIVEAHFVEHGDHTRTYWKRLDVKL